jgi:2',3'-cyclic-nucleotide 2'-phosphodiesterase (5'-nucleotidase family)
MLRIYHTSDLHDHRGIAAPLRALRDREPGLLFDCGDSLRGSQTVFYANEPIIAEIDAAGYDAQGMGNREFHYLYPALEHRVRRMRHPLVCSNLIDLRRRALSFVPTLDLDRLDETGRRWRLRLFSLLVVQYPEGSPWEKALGWRFLDPVATARRIAEATPDDRMLVALSHVGLPLDRRLAEAVPRIDLILGGHSHDTLHAPEFVNGIPIVHAGPYGAFVSRSEFALPATGRRPELTRFDLVPLLAP